MLQIKRANQVEHPVGHLGRRTFEFQHGIGARLEESRNTRGMHVVRVHRIVEPVLFAEAHARIDSDAGIFFAEPEPGATLVLRE